MTLLLPYQLQLETIITNQKTNRNLIEEIQHWQVISEKIPKLCDEFIALALISCDNNIEITKKTIVAHFKHKNDAPEIFNNRNVDNEDIQKSLTTTTSAIMPTRTEDNEAVIIYYLKNGNYSDFNLLPILKLAAMHVEAVLDPNPPDGIIIIADLAQIGFMHLTRLKVGIMKKMFNFLEEGLLIKLKAIYFLNTNYVCEKLLVIIKMITGDKLVKLLKAFPPNINMEQFHNEHVPAKCLPKEYGGDLPILEEMDRLTVEILRKSQNYFTAEEMLRKSI